MNLRERNKSQASISWKGEKQTALMSLPLALVHPRRLFVFSVSSRVDQAQRRKLAQVNQRERYDGIGRPFLRQGERVTARLPFATQGKKPCPDVRPVVQF